MRNPPEWPVQSTKVQSGPHASCRPSNGIELFIGSYDGSRRLSWSRGLAGLRPSLDDLVVRLRKAQLDDLLIRARQLLRPQLDRQLLDLAGEVERHLVIVVDRSAGVDADVERLTQVHDEGNRM